MAILSIFFKLKYFHLASTQINQIFFLLSMAIFTYSFTATLNIYKQFFLTGELTIRKKTSIDWKNITQGFAINNSKILKEVIFDALLFKFIKNNTTVVI